MNQNPYEENLKDVLQIEQITGCAITTTPFILYINIIQ